MPTAASRPVWYAAYGSNCSQDRLMAYLVGSQAADSAIVEQGGRDPSPPQMSAPCEIPYRVGFAGVSRKWGGGVAFLHHERAAVPSLGRRYLIAGHQLEDLVAQESRRRSVALPLDNLEPGTHRQVGSGPYDCLIFLDRIEGVPVVTFTSPDAPDQRDPAAPTTAYLGTIVRGLADVHDLSAAEIAARMLLSPGIEPAWSQAAIQALIDPSAD